MSAIVRVLWGAPKDEFNYSQIWTRDIQKNKKVENPTNFHVYVYGESNYKRLIENGYVNTHLIKKDPWPDWEDCNKNGQEVKPWIYKFELLKEAVKDHGKIIYCDWDVICRVKAKAAFKVIKNRKLLLSLVGYFRSKFLWDNSIRKKWDKIHHPDRLSVSGSFICVDGMDWLDDILERMKEPIRTEGPSWTQNWEDENVMTRDISERHNGWPGEEVWLNKYESPIMIQKKSPWNRSTSTGSYVIRDTRIPFIWRTMFIKGHSVKRVS